MSPATESTGANPAGIGVVLCDLDGVVWLSGEPIPGVVDAVARIRRSGRRVVFVTNNSAKTVAENEAVLASIGVPAAGDVVTSAMAAASLIAPGERVLVCGGAGIVEAVERRDATVFVAAQVGDEAGVDALGVDVPGVDVVVAGIDRAFDYRSLSIAADAVRGGARFVATNTDATFPTPTGLLPGAGAIVASLATASGTEPTVAGKPHAPCADLVRALVSPHGPDELLMVGDRPETDGAFAAEIGCSFALVRSGVTRPDEVLSQAALAQLPGDAPPTVDTADVGGVAAWLGCR